MHLGDSIFIFVLALVLFGPKRLPEIARQIGKLMVEFRRASNEFKMQMEEELRVMEQAEQQKTVTSPAAQPAEPLPGSSQLNIMPPSTGEQVSRIPPPEEAAAIAAATPLEQPVNRMPHETNAAELNGLGSHASDSPEANGAVQHPAPEPENLSENVPEQATTTHG